MDMAVEIITAPSSLTSGANPATCQLNPPSVQSIPSTNDTSVTAGVNESYSAVFSNFCVLKTCTTSSDPAPNLSAASVLEISTETRAALGQGLVEARRREAPETAPTVGGAWRAEMGCAPIEAPVVSVCCAGGLPEKARASERASER